MRQARLRLLLLLVIAVLVIGIAALRGLQAPDPGAATGEPGTTDAALGQPGTTGDAGPGVSGEAGDGGASTGGTKPSGTESAGEEGGGGAEAGGTAAGGGGTDGGGAPSGTDTGTETAAGFDLEPLIDGLERPVQIVPVPDGSGRHLIVEQGGSVRVLGDGGLAEELFLDLRGRITASGEQGLLSVAFHPRFDETRLVFVSYTDEAGDSIIARYRVAEGEPLRVDAGTRTTVLNVDQPYPNHNGGLVLFGPDGYLYFGLGDGGAAGDPHGHGQNTETLLGSILRLDVDVDPNAPSAYAVPPGNPLAQGPGRDEIWAFGLRNPWRFSFDRETGDLYIADVGQNAVEEVNVQPAGQGGLNFGWNVWEGSRRFRDTEPNGPVTFPVAEYSHDGGHCSITGGYVYRGRAIAALRGVYLFGDYCSGMLWGLRRAGDEWRMVELADTDLRIVSFGEDVDGELFLVDHGGAVYRLVPGRRPIPAALRGGG